MKAGKKDYWLYGKHSVLAAIANPKRKIFAVIIADHVVKEYMPYLQQLPASLIQRVDKHQFRQSLGDVNHQYIALETLPLTPPPLENILANKQRALVIILDQINDPHNLGAIMRSAAAFAADAVIVPKDNAVMENATVCKVASGAVEHIPLITVTNIADTIKKLKAAQFWLAGLDAGGDDSFKPLKGIEKLCLVIGSEEGLRRLTKTNCDFIVSIKISANVESLNMSTAAAIAFYEASNR